MLNKNLLKKKSNETEEQQTITFGDLHSVGNCHPECVGCSESKSQTACFSCRHFTQSLRNRAGFKCVSHCDTGFYSDGDKCKRCPSECETCSTGELCDTCHGAKLLIDVKHYGHLDHGRCVDSCPPGLSTIQAKCVLKINVCAAGYFESDQVAGVCLDCDRACALCHGPGPLQCDQCAQNYGNSSIGFCRPCCSKTQLQQNDNSCENCLLLKNIPSTSLPYFPTTTTTKTLYLFTSFIFVFILFFVTILFCLLLYKFIYFCCFKNGDGRSDLEYTPLTTIDHHGPYQNSSNQNEAFKLLEENSDSSDTEEEEIKLIEVASTSKENI
ncbi:hypothetical protein Mgra_00006528 [Meloidogyne graminicola]|uniref:Growth factor receptor domain-containing protein n=1 Tax=Meloidogyne graminicola TaxID=189291 RepID=A0A8S9ZL33_9BILA|nr:hypothetical protein Mgra_00006528 [Meloidogyne graminicola]